MKYWFIISPFSGLFNESLLFRSTIRQNLKRNIKSIGRMEGENYKMLPSKLLDFISTEECWRTHWLKIKR